MIDWNVAIGAVLVMLLGTWLAHRLSASRHDRNAYKAKKQEFQEMLALFLRTLELPDANPAILIAEHFKEHDEAARKLRIYMPRSKQRRFDQRWEGYENLYREKKAQGMLGQIATEVDDLSRASPGQPGAQAYIYQQTEKRRFQAIKVIQDALDVL